MDNRLVMKFGGSSMASLERIRHAAGHVARETAAGRQVAVVVSAMAGMTDEFVALTRATALLHDAREFDAVVCAGEQVTAGLLAMALQQEGISARSWLGWQLPIRTTGDHGSARIVEVGTQILEERLRQGQVAVIAGFQGIGPDNRVTTLGRGGSDLTAVAAAAALRAASCDIYTDVDGVYTCDPRIVASARRLAKITYEEMLELSSLGARVLQTRSVELAMAREMPLRVRASFAAPEDNDPGTLVCSEEDVMEQEIISGIAYARDEAKVTLIKVADKPGAAAAIFGPLAQAGVNVDMIVQNVSEDGRETDVTFTVSHADLPRAVEAIQRAAGDIGYARCVSDPNVAKISVVGIGMRSHAGIAQRMFRTLADNGINIQVISTSEIKISVLVEAQHTELAVRALHEAYGLDGA